MATRAESLDDGFRSFEQEWPELARRLEGFLAAKGVESWLRGDVVQETATRIYRKWAKLDHSRSVWNLVVTIALGVLVDERRKASRVELLSQVPQPDANDVETRALQRLHLVRTREALKQLRGDQRRVLLAEIGEAATLEGPRNQLNVLRLRARLALKSELGPWAPVGITLRMRSLRANIERRAEELCRGAHGVTASLASFAAAATVLTAGGGLSSTGPLQHGSLPRSADIVNSQHLDHTRLERVVADVRSLTSKVRSKANDRAEKVAEEKSALMEDPEGFVDDKREWAEGRKDYTEGVLGDAAERNKEWAEARKAHAEGTAKDTVERNEAWAEGRRDHAEGVAKDSAERNKKWAEDRLP